MVSRQEKKQSLEFMIGLLESSGKYAVLSCSNESARLKDVNSSNPCRYQIELANCFPSVDAFFQQVNHNRNECVYTVPVLYKDGNSAFVRMVDCNQSWRQNKSLKNYTPQQINEMLSLRKIEKKILGNYFLNLGLTYYQPHTERFDESLRIFQLEDVELDYSHLNQDDSGYGFAKDQTSTDYKIPTERETIFGAAYLPKLKDDKLLLAVFRPVK